LAAQIFLLVFPYYLQLVTSFTDMNFLGEYGKIYWWPQNVTAANLFENYKQAIITADLLTGLKNTVIFTVVTTGVSLIFAYVMGYVFGKMKFRGRNIVFMLILSSMMVPGEVLLVPLYLIVGDMMQLTDTMLAALIPGMINVFGIFLIKQFMNTIPDSILEAADIDGARELRKMFQIALPMSMPIVATYIIITFTAKWNEYLWPSIVLLSPKNFVLQQSLISFYPQFNGGASDGYLRAAVLILISTPIIIMYCTCQKYYLQSMNLSGIK
jgi:multiple sugar transport system permease protein